MFGVNCKIMSVHKYNAARNKALKTMTLGLIFLIFLPLGIPLSLLVIPFLAGRNGAKDLPSNWHLTYILTVGGGWSVGLVIVLITLLSIALGPALRINIAEIVIFASIILFTWASFTIGVTSSQIKTIDKERPYEKEWKEEEAENRISNDSKSGKDENLTKDEHSRTMAVHSNKEKEQTNFQKMKNFLNGPSQEIDKDEKKSKKKVKKDSKKSKENRVSALANRRRK